VILKHCESSVMRICRV